jgi:hypothetical protein
MPPAQKLQGQTSTKVSGTLSTNKPFFSLFKEIISGICGSNGKLITAGNPQFHTPSLPVDKG